MTKYVVYRENRDGDNFDEKLDIMSVHDTEASAEFAILVEKREQVESHWQRRNPKTGEYQLDTKLRDEWLGELPVPTTLNDFRITWDASGMGESFEYHVAETPYSA